MDQNSNECTDKIVLGQCFNICINQFEIKHLNSREEDCFKNCFLSKRDFYKKLIKKSDLVWIISYFIYQSLFHIEIHLLTINYDELYWVE